MKILQTTNYALFGKITGNRLINQKKIERLTEDINNGLNLLPYCPIVVYEDEEELKIVDGQHRFETSKSLGLPIHYVVCDKLNLKQIARINSRSDKWKNKDFLECYIKLGSKDYQVLADFIKEFDLIYSGAVDLLMYGGINRKNKSMDIFRDGEFKVNHLEDARQIVSLTQDVFDRYKFRSDRYLIKAMQELQEVGKCDFEVLKSKIAQAPMLMNPQTSVKEYKHNIERVYNHNNKNRAVIF